MSIPCPVPTLAPAQTTATILVHPAINTPRAVRDLEDATQGIVVIRANHPVLIPASER